MKMDIHQISQSENELLQWKCYGCISSYGDSSIYKAMVRFAQDFNERYMLIDGYGIFGNIDDDGEAAYRYTESRFSKISTELLKCINKDTVEMIPNI